jgi:hypothetical protein
MDANIYLANDYAKGAIRIRKTKKERRRNSQQKKDKQRSTKYYPENKRSSNTNSTKNLNNSIISLEI